MTGVSWNQSTSTNSEVIYGLSALEEGPVIANGVIVNNQLDH